MSQEDSKPDQHFPNDRRKWFRTLIDFLHDPKLTECSADVFRFYFRLLGMLRESDSATGQIMMGQRALKSCALKSRYPAALKLARYCADNGLITLSYHSDNVLIAVPNWPKIQGFRKLRTEQESAKPSPSRCLKGPDKVKGQAQTPSLSQANTSVVRNKGKGKPPSEFPLEFPDHDRQSLIQWAFQNCHTEGAVDYAIDFVRDWAVAGGHKRKSWPATIRNGIRAGWALEGFEDRSGATKLSYGQRTAARTKEAARNVLRDAMAKSAIKEIK